MSKYKSCKLGKKWEENKKNVISSNVSSPCPSLRKDGNPSDPFSKGSTAETVPANASVSVAIKSRLVVLGNKLFLMKRVASLITYKGLFIHYKILAIFS